MSHNHTNVCTELRSSYRALCVWPFIAAYWLISCHKAQVALESFIIVVEPQTCKMMFYQFNTGLYVYWHLPQLSPW